MTSIVNIISVFIFVVLMKKLVNLSAKIVSLATPNKTDQRDIQIQKEEFNREPISE